MTTPPPAWRHELDIALASFSAGPAWSPDGRRQPLADFLAPRIEAWIDAARRNATVVVTVGFARAHRREAAREALLSAAAELPTYDGDHLDDRNYYRTWLHDRAEGIDELPTGEAADADVKPDVSVGARIAALRDDPEFQQRLRERIDADRGILDRLAECHAFTGGLSGWCVRVVDGKVCGQLEAHAVHQPAGAPPPAALPWRVGRKVGRTLYVGDDCVGIVDTPELAARIVAAVNATPGHDSAQRRAVGARGYGGEAD